MHKHKSRIETPKESYMSDYPSAVKAAIAAQSIFWTAEELKVDKDANDVKMKMSKGEVHALRFAQTIITQYELMIGGEELWGGKIQKLFPRHDITRACQTFAFFELCVHAPFYDLINKAMGIATDEFYTAWQQDEDLAKRIDQIEKFAASDDALEVTAALAFLEGAVLFSLFAFFKSFNTRGHNLIPRFVAGINGSAKDENFHSQFSSWLFRQCLSERQALGNHSDEEHARLVRNIGEMASDVLNHEYILIDRMFEVEGIRTIEKEEMKHFVRDRIKVVFEYLGLEDTVTDPSEKPGIVSEWFYNQLSTYKHSDFFAVQQLEYRRDWEADELEFNPDWENEELGIVVEEKAEVLVDPAREYYEYQPELEPANSEEGTEENV